MSPSRWFLVAGLFAAAGGCGKEAATSKGPAQPPTLAIAPNRPALELVSGDGQLGAADFGEKRQCTFLVRNNTPQPMHLSIADKSCTCAGARLEPEQVEPGQTCTVTLFWTPKAEVLETTTTRLWTEVRDQSGATKLRLEATGTLEPKVQFAFPRGPLDFGRLDLSELENPAKVLIVEAYSPHPGMRISMLRSTLEGIQIVGSAEPLGADRLAQLDAQSGWRISVKPTGGLPTGRFLGHLQVTTSLSHHGLDLPMSGSFETGLISLSHERIDLPPRLSLKDGYRIPPIILTVRQGPCTSCEVQTITPALFQTKVTRLGDKTWRIELTLPTGLDLATAKLSAEQWTEWMEFGFERGQLTLRLDHPEMKWVHIPLAGSQLVR